MFVKIHMTNHFNVIMLCVRNRVLSCALENFKTCSTSTNKVKTCSTSTNIVKKNMPQYELSGFKVNILNTSSKLVARPSSCAIHVYSIG